MIEIVYDWDKTIFMIYKCEVCSILWVCVEDYGL